MNQINLRIKETVLAKMLSDLTLVIPTYERPAHATRSMRYWSGRPVKVVMVDGSARPIPAETLAGAGENVTYIHSPTSVLNRLQEAASQLDTEFVSLLGDDEFHIPSALSASVAELKSDRDLVACIGRAVRFNSNSNGAIVGSPQYPKFENRFINGNTARERMLAHMADYTPSTIYSVVRHDIWRAAMDSYFQKDFPTIGEIQFELGVCYLGKCKVIPVLHWLRSMDAPRIDAAPDISLQKDNRFYDWWQSSDNAAEKSDFINITASSPAKASGRSGDAVASEVEAALTAYYEFIQSAIKTRNERLRQAKKSPSMFSFLKKSSAPPQVTSKSLIEEATELERRGVAVDFDELLEIEGFIRRTAAQVDTLC